MNPIIAANKVQLAALNSQVVVLISNAETLKGQRDGANTSLAAAQLALDAANDHVKALQAQVDGDATQLSTALASANAQISALQAQIIALQGQALTAEDSAELASQGNTMRDLTQDATDANVVTAPGN